MLHEHHALEHNGSDTTLALTLLNFAKEPDA
jgi:hypothetical protein